MHAPSSSSMTQMMAHGSQLPDVPNQPSFQDES